MPLYPIPLTDQHIEALREVVRHAQQTDEMCRDTAECGLPIGELHEQNTAQVNMARAILHKFAPHQS